MWITHSYIGTTKTRFRCLFFLLFEDYIDAQAGLSKDLDLELERFARNMGNFGAVVRPFPGDVRTTRNNILDKPWTKTQRESVQNTPAMLMIDKDFDQFDPRNHPWVLFHFGRGGSQDAEKFRSLLEKVCDAIATEDRNPFDIVRRSLRNAVIKDASKTVQLKPGIFGISIDLRTAWSSMKDYLRAQRSDGGNL
jgi:hypothetical protein